MEIDFFKSNIYDGMNFKKVRDISNIISVKDDGFTYRIGKNDNCKKILYKEVEESIKE